MPALRLWRDPYARAASLSRIEVRPSPTLPRGQYGPGLVADVSRSVGGPVEEAVGNRDRASPAEATKCAGQVGRRCVLLLIDRRVTPLRDHACKTIGLPLRITALNQPILEPAVAEVRNCGRQLVLEAQFLGQSRQFRNRGWCRCSEPEPRLISRVAAGPVTFERRGSIIEELANNGLVSVEGAHLSAHHGRRLTSPRLVGETSARRVARCETPSRRQRRTT